MSIYNSPYRLRPINSAAARGIAPGDSLEIAAVQRVKVVKVYHTELRQSGDEDAPPKEKAKRNGLRRRYGKFKRGGKASNLCNSERRNSGHEYEALDKWLASDAWRRNSKRKRKAKRKRGRHRYCEDKASKGKKNTSLAELCKVENLVAPVVWRKMRKEERLEKVRRVVVDGLFGKYGMLTEIIAKPSRLRTGQARPSRKRRIFAILRRYGRGALVATGVLQLLHLSIDD